MMSIAAVTHRVADGVPIVAVSGEIDVSNVADLMGKILERVPNDAPGLVLDLSATTYIDSQGLRLLLELEERLRIRQQRLIAVVPARSLARRLIELTHLSTTIQVESEIGAAVTHMQGRT